MTLPAEDPSPPPGAHVPRLVVLTDREQARRSLRVTVLEVAAAGAPAVLLREKDLDRDRRRRLGTQLSAVSGGLGTALLVAGDPELAAEVGSGVHLGAADDPVPEDLRGELLVGRSCHDREEVLAAVAEGVDYVSVSPVAETASKPGHGPPLGPDQLADLVAAAGDVPVLALGGVAPGNVEAWLRAGAHGVAVMGAVMRAKQPADVVKDLLDHLEEAAA